MRDVNGQRVDGGGGGRRHPNAGAAAQGQPKGANGSSAQQQGPHSNLASISHYPSAFHQPAAAHASAPAFLPSPLLTGSSQPAASPRGMPLDALPLSAGGLPAPDHADGGPKPAGILVSHYGGPRGSPDGPAASPAVLTQQLPSLQNLHQQIQAAQQKEKALPPKPKKRGHSEIEKNRREAINDRISELKDVLPIAQNMPQLTANKTAILGTAVEHLTTLVLENKSLKMELDQLQRELSRLRLRAEKSQRAAAHAHAGAADGNGNGSSSSSANGNGGGGGIDSSNASWSNGNGGEEGGPRAGDDPGQRPGSRSGSDDSSEDAGTGSSGDGSNGNGSPPFGRAEESPPRTHSNAASAGTAPDSAGSRAEGGKGRRGAEADGSGSSGGQNSRPSSAGSLHDEPAGDGTLPLPEGPTRVSPSAIWAADCDVEGMGGMDAADDLLVDYGEQVPEEGPEAAAEGGGGKRPLTLHALMHRSSAAKSPPGQAAAVRPRQSSPHGSSSSSGSGSGGNGNGSSGSQGHGSSGGNGSSSSGNGNGANGSSGLSAGSSRTPPELRSLTLGPEREFLKRGELGSMSGMIVSTTGPAITPSHSSADNDDSKSSGGSSSGARTPLSSSSGNGGKGSGDGDGAAARSKTRERKREAAKKRAADAEAAAAFAVTCRGFSDEQLASTARRLGRLSAAEGEDAMADEGEGEGGRGRAEASEAVLTMELPLAHVSMRQFFAVNLKMAMEGLLVADEAPDGSGPAISFASEGIERLTGYSAAELAGKPLAFLRGTPAGASSDLADAVAQARLDGVLRLAEVVCRRKDGRPFWALLCFQPVRDSADRSTGLVAALMDVSALKKPGFKDEEAFVAAYTGLSGGDEAGPATGLPPSYQSGAFGFSRFRNVSQPPASPEGEGAAEGAASQHHRLLHALASLLTMAMSTMLVTNAADDDYRITYTTPGYQMMTGYSRRELLGKNCRMLQGRDTDRSACRLLKRHLAAGERSVLAELVNYRRDGGSFVNLMHIVPVPTPAGRVTRFISVHADVTAFVPPRGEPAPAPAAWAAASPSPPAPAPLPAAV